MSVGRTERPHAFGTLPDELAALGAPRDPRVLFGALQRPWTWDPSGPSVGRETRAFLASALDASLPEVARKTLSADGASKVLFRLTDGALVEAVHMPRAVRNPRVTLCISSQVGCGLGCAFCATARLGLVRQLSAGEMVGQVLMLMRRLGPRHPQSVTVVFMGMGEPLANFENVVRAIRVLCHPAGLGMSANRITVSTAGLVPAIERLARVDPRPLLAVSVNAPRDELRARLMPINQTFDLRRLRTVLSRWPLRAGEKITFEYVLLAGENDRDADADELAAFVGGLRHNVNLIPFNAFRGSVFREPEEERVRAFARRLQAWGCLVTVRRSRGRDVDAACGQLVAARLSDAPILPF